MFFYRDNVQSLPNHGTHQLPDAPHLRNRRRYHRNVDMVARNHVLPRRHVRAICDQMVLYLIPGLAVHQLMQLKSG